MSREKLMQEWMETKRAMDLLKKRQTVLRQRLFDTLDSEGTVDAKGNKWVTIETDDKIIEAKKERRFSVKVNQEKALDFLNNRNNKELFEKCTQTQVVIYEPSLEEAILEGEISEQETEVFTDTKESFALKVKETEKEI